MDIFLKKERFFGKRDKMHDFRHEFHCEYSGNVE